MERRSYIWARLLSNVDIPKIMTAHNKRSTPTSKKAAAAHHKAAATKDQVPEEPNIQELLKRLAEQQTMIEQLTHIPAAEDRCSKPLGDDESELMLPPCLVATCMIPVDVAEIANGIGREALTENHGSPNVPLAESTVARRVSEKPARPNSKLMERWDKWKWLTMWV